MSHPPTGWPGALHRYTTAMEAAGRASGTVKLRLYYLRRLSELYPRGPWTVTLEHLQAFLSYPDWEPETRRSVRSSVVSFYRWGHGSGFIEDDPAFSLEPVRGRQGVPHPTPKMMVRQMLRDGDDRLRLMVMLAAYAGLRRSEIAVVHSRDLAGDDLIVHGKGKKTRAVPIVDLELYDRLSALDGWAFPGQTDGHLSPGHVGVLLSRAMATGWSGHSLRHRCGTSAFAATGDLPGVMRLLGHSRPETTMIYTELPEDSVRAAARGAAQLA